MCNCIFKYLLWEIYFCPQRDEKYSSDALKLKAMHAMYILWNSDKQYALGKVYDKKQIRKLIVQEMTPDMLDSAIEFYLCFKEPSVFVLANLILITVIYSKPYAEFTFNRERIKSERCDVA